MTLIRPFTDVSPTAELVLADVNGTTILRLTTDSRVQNFAVGSSLESSAIDLAAWTQPIPPPP